MRSGNIVKNIRNELLYRTVLVCVKLLRLLPRFAAIRLARGIARLVFLVAKAPRQRTLENLTRAYDKEISTAGINRLARQVFLHFATVAVDFLRLPVLSKSELDKLVSTSGMEHLDQALTAGRGAILLTAHFGNWELLGAWGALHGYPVKVVSRSLEDPRLDRILVGIRNQAGYTNIHRGSATREIIRSLRQGYCIGILIDQDTTKVPGMFAEFFGRPAYTPPGPVILARKHRIPILPIFMRLQPDFSYHIECGAPLPLPATDDRQRDIAAGIQLCTDTYEAMIRRYPAQWTWMHKRWKTQPSADRP